jgi:hypothetical protein
MRFDGSMDGIYAAVEGSVQRVRSHWSTSVAL